ncbi:hypothetical protein [Pseudomonas sp. BRM28]|uniref:hypothetical protein n=1 Tax=Pseudomonas sp. BRM28 TaxID=2045201 RepID=UPI00211598FF|nr:hypothetical protein [Pseudomonas sp. BRM28]
MPTENRSSNAERVTAAPATAQHRIHIEVRECEGCNHIGIDDAHSTLAACHECDWSGPEPVEDKCPGCGRENVMAAACPDCGSRYVLAASKHFEIPAPQNHPEPIAWMVGTAIWWARAEAERDSAEVGLPVVGLGPMAVSDEVEQLQAALKFYADRDHFSEDIGSDWDSVSGEPANVLWHDSEAWFVEDGSIARAALERKL